MAIPTDESLPTPYGSFHQGIPIAFILRSCKTVAAEIRISSKSRTNQLDLSSAGTVCGKKTKDENPKPKSPPLGKSLIEQLKEQAVIGPSISIKGELSGEEDLMIQGRVEGKIDLKKNNVTVGRNGHIKGDIYGKIISIEGEVQGNLFGEENIVIRESGVVRGNMTASRVNLEDGAKFKGNVTTDPDGEEKQPPLKEVPLAPDRNVPTKS